VCILFSVIVTRSETRKRNGKWICTVSGWGTASCVCVSEDSGRIPACQLKSNSMWAVQTIMYGSARVCVVWMSPYVLVSTTTARMYACLCGVNGSLTDVTRAMLSRDFVAQLHGATKSRVQLRLPTNDIHKRGFCTVFPHFYDPLSRNEWANCEILSLYSPAQRYAIAVCCGMSQTYCYSQISRWTDSQDLPEAFCGNTSKNHCNKAL